MTKSTKDEFMGMFWKLSNPDDAVRISASENIVKELLNCQQKRETTTDEEGPWCPEVKYAMGRLLQGLASERKASRLGYSCALTHLLAKLDIKDDSDIGTVLSLANEKLKSSKDKNMEKGVLLGKVFAFLAVIKSCKVDSASTSVKLVFDGLMKLSKLKSYLRPVSLHGISELVQKVPNPIFDEVMWPQLSGILSKGWGECDAEIFQILETCYKYQSETCGKTFLKTYNWIGQKAKKIELIGIHSYKHLGRMLPATTVCHPKIHPLCYKVVNSVVKSENEIFKKFWKDSIEIGLLDSTPERIYLALKLSIHVLPSLNVDQIAVVWSSRVVTSLMHIFSNKANPLHTVCKFEIIEEICNTMKNDSMTAEKQLSFLFRFFTSPAGLFLDDNTNTRCISAFAGSLNLDALQKYIAWLRKVYVTGKLNYEGVKEVALDTARRWSLSQLSQLIRNHRLPREDKWLFSTTQFLFTQLHFISKHKGIVIPGLEDLAESPPLSEKTKEHLKHCLEPALNALNSMPPLKKDHTQRSFHGTASDGEFWICKFIEYSNSLITKHKMDLVKPMGEKSQEMWQELVDRLTRINDITSSDKTRKTEGTALRLLLSHVGIRLINCTDEEIASTHEVLGELFSVADERFDKEIGEKDKGADPELNWVEVVIETILGMLSQNSRSIRSVADQVFKLLSPQLTRNGLHLILDVLDPTRSKDVLQDDDADGQEEDNDDDEEMDCEEDINKAEDVGEEENEGEESDSEDSAFDDDDVSDDISDNDNKFREKIKEALGDAAESSDDDEQGSNNADKEEVGDENEDDSGPEMDDEAMMRIDSVLAEVFRQKKLSKRKVKEDSHQQLLVFQLRCLDLIEIMANRRHNQESDEVDSDSLVLEAVRPLLIAIQHASKRASDMTLAEKASVLLRVKICKMKRYPRNLSDEMIKRCHGDIEAIMAVAYKAQSVFICQLASDCCLFFLKVLCGNNTKQSGKEVSSFGAIDVGRVLNVYKGVVENFMVHRESHLQPCIIQDFIARFPAIAANLAPDFLKYVKDGVQTYRRTRACIMLHDLIKNSASKEKCKSLLFQIISVANELIERAGDSDNMKAKYYVELLKLYHQAVSVLHSSDRLKSLNKSDLTSSLQKFLRIASVVKSQEMTNWTWKVLHILGLERSTHDTANKKGKKRKKTNSESDKNNAAEQTVQEETLDETKQESKRELKARILKEKKERRKKKTEASSKDMQKSGESITNEEDKTKKKRKKLKKKPVQESES